MTQIPVCRPKLTAVLELQFSVQPAGQNENRDSDRGAQEWGTGKRNMMGKHQFHYIYGC